MTRITIIDGHPDPDPARYGHALVAAYADAARAARHQVRILRLADMDIPVLRSRAEWTDGNLPPSLRHAQEDIQWAAHLVFTYPLWMGDMPALLKAFLEQVFRPGFALDYGKEGSAQSPQKLLRGRSARLIVTMGMPSLFYRAYYAAHSVRSFKRNILQLTGIDPVSMCLIGNVESSESHRARWLGRVADHGNKGD